MSDPRVARPQHLIEARRRLVHCSRLRLRRRSGVIAEIAAIDSKFEHVAWPSGLRFEGIGRAVVFEPGRRLNEVHFAEAQRPNPVRSKET